MKTIKQLREEYDRVSLSQVQLPDELMLEGRESAVKPASKSVPSPANMPAMLLFRRVQYRSFPGNQTVALYYSKMVNKYLSVPFGPDGNLNLSEAVVLDDLEEGVLKTIAKTAAGAAGGLLKYGTLGGITGSTFHAPGLAAGAAIGGTLGAIKGARKAYNKAREQENMEEDWSDAKYKSPSGGLTQAGVDAYNRQTGGHLKTAVTTKPSKLKKGSKAANRRKSFCARMGGMKKRLTSAKTARDPDSRINKALRKWNCEESFRDKLNILREEKVKPWMDYSGLGGAVKTATELTPGASAYQKTKERDYTGAATSAALDAAGYGLVTKGLKFARKGYQAAKNLTKTRKAAAAAGAAGGAAATAATEKKEKDPSTSNDIITPHKADLVTDKTKPKMSSSYENAYRQKVMSGHVNENKISDIQNMLNEGNDTMDLSINGRTVTLNNSMAKKIVRVYESVNTKNKKIVESMLNEDLDSFKKLLNFSIKA